ncbi:hypothetical protein QE152_g18963 [Popillia japonica]|uniref:Uncharacterized protein n=1 Tax=Popillia japonica TaxID=7064 RepID=A0AAW1L444_POPJA
MLRELFRSEYAQFVKPLEDKLNHLDKKLIETTAHLEKTLDAQFVKPLEDKLNHLDKKLIETTAHLEKTLDEQEQYSRKCNLKIFGVPVLPNENTDELFKNIYKEKMAVNLPEYAIEISHRLPAREKTIPPIIIKFSSSKFKKMIFGCKNKLRGTSYVIREDLTRRRF